MLKTKLKPYVHKVKGIKNYGLYDILNGKFYTLSPDGDMDTLKNSLKEAGLTFETRGTVPFPISLDMSPVRKILGIRELQIRLSGYRETNCWERKKIEGEKRFISMECMTRLKHELADISVKTLRIESETVEQEKILLLLSEYPYQKAILFTKEAVSPNLETQVRKICNNRGSELIILSKDTHEQEITELQVSAYDFFYRQLFNPCLGHKVAVDCGGEVKPCLWWPEPLGFIGKDILKNFLISGAFDGHWERTKNKIAVCKECEQCYACNDCRVSFISVKDDQYSDGKPAFCDYNPNLE